MVEWMSAGGQGARKAWIALGLAWFALSAAAPVALAQSDDRRASEPLWDKYPLETQRDATAAVTPPPAALDDAGDDSGGTERAALLISVALLGGGVAGWVLSLRRPHARAKAAAHAAPLDAPVRPAQPRLWAPSENGEAAPVLAAAPAAGPEPPDRDLAWSAAIEWHLVDGGSQFRVMGRPLEGDAEPSALGTSPLLDWPPAGPQSVQSLAEAVKRLETKLVAAGWTPLERGTAWYAKRFAWQPGALPPAGEPGSPARMRHRSLYEDEYDRQLDRTLRRRQEIADAVLPPDRHDHPVGAAPEWDDQRS